MRESADTPGWQQVIGCILLPVIAPVAIVLIPILNVLGLHKSKAGPEYLVEYLERFVEGTEGPWDLDDFCSVPLSDPVLDELRLEACDHLPAATGDIPSIADLEALERLLEKARALKKAH